MPTSLVGAAPGGTVRARRYNAAVTDSIPSSDRPVTGRRFSSNAEADRHDAEFWQQIPAADRVLLAWRLSVEQWELLGRAPDEPGLCRSVASVRRR
jgi:hypothetical protein